MRCQFIQSLLELLQICILFVEFHSGFYFFQCSIDVTQLLHGRSFSKLGLDILLVDGQSLITSCLDFLINCFSLLFAGVLFRLCPC